MTSFVPSARKARNLIESGEMGHDHKGRKMPRMDGDGLYASIFQAAMGVTEPFGRNISSIYSRRMRPSTRNLPVEDNGPNETEISERQISPRKVLTVRHNPHHQVPVHRPIQRSQFC
jgi:hypothetical protein